MITIPSISIISSSLTVPFLFITKYLVCLCFGCICCIPKQRDSWLGKLFYFLLFVLNWFCDLILGWEFCYYLYCLFMECVCRAILLLLFRFFQCHFHFFSHIFNASNSFFPTSSFLYLYLLFFHCKFLVIFFTVVVPFSLHSKHVGSFPSTTTFNIISPGNSTTSGKFLKSTSVIWINSSKPYPHQISCWILIAWIILISSSACKRIAVGTRSSWISGWIFPTSIVTVLWSRYIGSNAHSYVFSVIVAYLATNSLLVNLTSIALLLTKGYA